ncbi:glycosyltransferase family 2 protein [Sphingobacterium hotanense]|uniref:glycosyltransferase family 2 protein n=1 Tax=Sphingobacterium hotanense TaxID=649196 RepID=UPI0011F39CC1|nr:glycosyltransferase [Sphingobacterium hotanense]
MVKDLVSIITPCYNSRNFLDKLLESVLIQDYPSIEMILVDDGSVDELAEFLKEHDYFNRFEARGFKLYYCRQENMGQAVAINLGLTKYSGEYLTWPDSDDYYYDHSAISSFVNAINMSDVDIIRCYPRHVDQLGNDLGFHIPNFSDDRVFEECLLENNFWFSPICYFFKASNIKKVLDNRIIPSRVGQNFQLYLPLFYFGNLSTLKLDLVNYLVRSNSHSHSKKSYAQALERLDNILELKLQILNEYDLRIEPTLMKSLYKKFKLSYLNVRLEYGRIGEAFLYLTRNLMFSKGAYLMFIKKVFLQRSN